jgi:glycosyltransferase involved in cell wall biosynthesis
MARRPDRTRATLADWQKEWGQLIDAADQVTVFSESSRSLVLATYPRAEPVLRVVPHSLAQPVPLIETGNADVDVIGILGNIGLQKGAAVAQDLARMAETRGDFRLVLIGNIDPAFSLPRSVPVHGNYHVTELDSLAAKYGITCWLIPSIWPETFSYTTHECIATGLPVYAFNIGAQGDAVRDAANGHVIEFSAEGNLAQNILRQALDRE